MFSVPGNSKKRSRAKVRGLFFITASTRQNRKKEAGMRAYKLFSKPESKSLYRKGLNEIAPKASNDEIQSGYFCFAREHILRFLPYVGHKPYISEVEIPANANVIEQQHYFKSDKIIINGIKPFDWLTLEELIREGAECKGSTGRELLMWILSAGDKKMLDVFVSYSNIRLFEEPYVLSAPARVENAGIFKYLFEKPINFSQSFLIDFVKEIIGRNLVHQHEWHEVFKTIFPKVRKPDEIMRLFVEENEYDAIHCILNDHNYIPNPETLFFSWLKAFKYQNPDWKDSRRIFYLFIVKVNDSFFPEMLNYFSEIAQLIEETKQEEVI